MSTSILGISAFYHDSAAALLIDGEVVAAAQEERFTRKKHDDAFPSHATRYCLEHAGLAPDQLDFVGFYDKPLLTFERLLETYLRFAPKGFKSFLRAMPVWLNQKLRLPRELNKGLGGAYGKRYVFSEHHESHAASAFYSSPFDAAAILTLDGVGEWTTASYGIGRGNEIDLSHELRFPHSIGLLYSAFTYYTGFEVNSGEYKLMGLAPYGEPVFVDRILEHLIDLKDDGSFRMDQSYFDYCTGLTMTNAKFERLFDLPRRRPEDRIRRHDMDVAASIQHVTEEIMLRAARHVHAATGMSNLCLAGGVALNCVGNGRILREGPFDDVWIQPAAGDAGGALGVAQLIWHQLLKNPRTARPSDSQFGSLLGVEYGDAEIEEFLVASGAEYERIDDDDELCDAVAGALEAGEVVGWFQDRMEFGPRALGSRSILGDARVREMQSVINQKVKFREGFRPFAPIVLEQYAHEYFELEPGQESPYMLLVTPVREDKRVPVEGELQAAEGIDRLQQARSCIPAVTHVDYSARVQTVGERHGKLRRLLEKFHARTGCPVLVNTSFNLAWEPIVCSPADAYRTYMASEIDLLCMGHFVLRKARQPAAVPATAGDTPDGLLEVCLRSPCCNARVAIATSTAVCVECQHAFAITDDIPQLFWPHEDIDNGRDVTEVVKSFYEETPFPNYNDLESVRTLIEKSRQGHYARRLDETIPYNTTVLEVGCGTGQLTNFLGVSCRRVIGTDMCLNSLLLGEEFRKRHGLRRVRFAQMNLFRPALAAAQFDVMICNGVLHHTADPFGGLRALVPLVKPGGHVIVGLYNAFGRLLTDARRQLFRLTGGRMLWIDPILRKAGLSKGRRKAWFEDQYRHPHESKHTFGEVLQWFDELGIEFVRGVPALVPDLDGLEGRDLFEPQPRGTALDHFVVQATQILAAGQREGGFFVMIGRVPED